MAAPLAFAFAALALFAVTPPALTVPPPADADVALTDGQTLHLRMLPLGQMDGVVRDEARFDASGTRVALLATFPGGSVDGNWRTTAPTQAYVVDMSRRTLTALTSDGQASDVRWGNDSHLTIADAQARRIVAVAPATNLGASTHRGRLQAIAAQPEGDVVSPPEIFRLQVFKLADGSYAIGQVGAVRLRSIALASNGQYEVIGPFIAWIDGSRSGGPPLSRSGSDDVTPPSFAGSAYGDSLTPLLPLGHAVYQGAYRNGIAYFAFSYGIARIVATTSDFVNFAYPQLPADPAFTVGDGLGAGADGTLYFARAEDGTLQYWHRNRFVERSMRFPEGTSDTQRLFKAMAKVAAGEIFEPPMRPDTDALDAALLEWRIYPIGDSMGDRWIASYLGRAYVAGSDLTFSEIAEPSYPFAVLGRTDDGRIWGATPLRRAIQSGTIVAFSARLWSSRDGVHWGLAATLSGDPGAVGLRAGVAWVALTNHEPDAAGIEVARVGAATVLHGVATGAIYAGEDLFFANLSGGLYLVCGGAPGTREDNGAGPLVALRLDAGKLFDVDDRGFNVYLRDRLSPAPAKPADVGISDAEPIVDPSFAELAGTNGAVLPTIVTDLAPPTDARVRMMTFEEARAFRIEYAWVPYPLSEINVSRSGGGLTVNRRIERGPLAASGTVERWSRDANGSWKLISTVSRWKL